MLKINFFMIVGLVYLKEPLDFKLLHSHMQSMAIVEVNVKISYIANQAPI